MSKGAVLHHPDYVAASVPWKSGRPFEIFVDASDYGWSAVLCQRPKPHAAPKIIHIISKAFSDTQLRWSAMERELYALWQGVVGFERLIRGFKVYVYMDHKNSLYHEALIDNRRIAKKMLNWALEIQHFNIVRVWIRGEANILADAPSRAPWGCKLMEHLPLADMPLRELIRKMYREPEAFERDVEAARQKKGQTAEWKPMDGDGDEPAVMDLPQGFVTPQFGMTPDFGSLEGDAGEESAAAGREAFKALCQERVGAAYEVEAEGLTKGACIQSPLGVYPAWPMWQQDECTEKVAVTFGRTAANDYLPLPMNTGDVPWMIERIKDNAQHYYIVRWPKMVLFNNGERKASIWFSVGRFGSDEAALKAAWRYFSDRFRGIYSPEEEVDIEGNEIPPRNHRGGPISETDADGIVFHGDGSHRFTRWTSFGKPIGSKFKVVCWQKHNVRRAIQGL